MSAVTQPRNSISQSVLLFQEQEHMSLNCVEMYNMNCERDVHCSCLTLHVQLLTALKVCTSIMRRNNHRHNKTSVTVNTAEM